MYRFIETICIEGGEIQNLSRHNARMNATRKCFFGRVPELKLEHSIHVPENDLRRTRCRVTYGAEILNIEYFPYQIRPVKSLRLIKEDNINYRYKYADRSGLDRLFTQRETADDILIIKNGLLTDTSIANIALWDGRHWYTPTHPLLKGTRRAELLDNGVLIEKNIATEEIKQYQKICLFNAMLHFGEIELPCTQIKSVNDSLLIEI